MNAKTNKAIKFAILLLLIVPCVILFSSNPVFWLIVDFSLMIAIIIKSKISFFSVNALVSTYPLVAIICEYYFGFSYGLLHVMNVPIHITEIAICIAIYDFCLGYIVFFTDSLEKERQMLSYIPKKCTKFTSEIFAIISSLLVIIAFPYGFFTFEGRQQALFKGQAWMLLALYCCFFALNHFSKSMVVKIFCSFTVIWYFLHAERVEFIGFLIMVISILLYRKKTRSKISIKQYVIFAIISFVVIIAMAFVGNLVRGSSTDISAVFKSVFLQGSMVDIMYVFNTGVDYVSNYGIIKGETFGVYLDKAFLFTSSDRSYISFLNSYMRNAGGGYALTDGYLNFGYIGVFVQSLIQIVWVRFCLKKQTNYRYFCYCFLFSLCFRYTWYGYYYYEKTPILYVPVFLFLVEIIYILTKRRFETTEREGSP